MLVDDGLLHDCRLRCTALFIHFVRRGFLSVVALLVLMSHLLVLYKTDVAWPLELVGLILGRLVIQHNLLVSLLD